MDVWCLCVCVCVHVMPIGFNQGNSVHYDLCVCQLPLLGVIQSTLSSCLWQFSRVRWAFLHCRLRFVRGLGLYTVPQLSVCPYLARDLVCPAVHCAFAAARGGLLWACHCLCRPLRPVLMLVVMCVCVCVPKALFPEGNGHAHRIRQTDGPGH